MKQIIIRDCGKHLGWLPIIEELTLRGNHLELYRGMHQPTLLEAFGRAVDILNEIEDRDAA